MQNNVTYAPTQSSGGSAFKIILIVVGVIVAFVALICLIPVCVIAILTLLGPQIANTFSKVTNGLGQ